MNGFCFFFLKRFNCYKQLKDHILDVHHITFWRCGFPQCIFKSDRRQTIYSHFRRGRHTVETANPNPDANEPNEGNRPNWPYPEGFPNEGEQAIGTTPGANEPNEGERPRWPWPEWLNDLLSYSEWYLLFSPYGHSVHKIRIQFDKVFHFLEALRFNYNLKIVKIFNWTLLYFSQSSGC